MTPQEKRQLLENLLREKAARERAPAYPLSLGQQALWFLHDAAPESAAYNTAFATRIRSGVNVAVMRRAFQALIARHPALRSVFRRSPAGPIQAVREGQELEPEVVDVSGASDEDLRRHVVASYGRPFDLERGPLVRVSLFTRAPQDHVLLLAAHHIICDAWSLWILMNDFRLLYGADLREEVPDLAPATRPYRDFVRWQQEMLSGPEGDRLWSFWRAQLAGELPMVDLPADRARPPVLGQGGASHFFDIGAGVLQRLRELARAEGATLYTVLLSAFVVLLRRYGNQQEIIIGTPVAGRTQPGFEQTVGYFVNPVVLRLHVPGDAPFLAVAAAVRQTVLEALERQDYPFPLLVEKLRPTRDPGRSPLFQNLFVLQQSPPGTDPASDVELRMEHFEIPQMEGQFDLTLEMVEAADRLRCVFKYSTDLFDVQTIRRMSGHFQTALDGILAAPGRRVSELPLLSQGERRQILVEWNDTNAPFDEALCLHQCIEAQVERTPGSVAVVFENQPLTYRELNSRANQLAHRLRRLGAGPESLVGVCMERSTDLVVALLGVLKSGSAYVPLDPDYPAERVEFMRRDSRCAVVLASGSAELERLGDESEENPRVPMDPENPAYVIYTSGSTGRPKGAINTHRGIVNRLLWMQKAYALDADDRVLQKTPFSFDVSVWEFFWPLMTGACLVVAAPGGHRDSAYLIRAIRAHRVTTLHFVPSMLDVFLEEARVETCVSLRRVIASGEALSAELQDRFFLRLGGAELHNLYGPTEAAVDVTAWRCRRSRPRRSVPIGRPIDNTRVYILDDKGEPAPPGVAGELHIAGVGLARGYLNRADLTAERFVPNPFGNGSRLYRTGDLARFASDGEIEYLGRLDYQVKIRGFRVELGEVEAVLSQHPSIREAAVAARADGLTAYVVASGAAQPRLEELRRWLQQTLPEYMTPSAFVRLERLPLSPNGKLDRKALATVAGTRLESAATPAPETETHARIAAIWREVLRVERAGIHDNFFDLGGHSLLMAQVLRKVNAAFGSSLSMLDLFRYPTIQSLAAALTADGTPKPERKRRERDGGAGIAVIGMACRFPGAPDVESFWRNLCDGVESIASFSDEELTAAGVDPAALADPNYVRASGLLRDIDLFDAAFFGFNPREAEVLDVQHRQFLECAWEALERAGYDPGRYEGAIGVYAGAGMNSYLLHNLYPNRGVVESAGGFETMIGNDKDFLPTRVSYKLNLTGPSVSVQTACSTSLVAVHLACRSLAGGECDMALAGGVSIHIPQISGYLYREGMILSPDGHCRAFDQDARGTVAGSGVGIVILKRLEDALRAGDHIHAVIKGSAINNDGALKAGYTAPSVAGQEAVIAAALDAARVDSSSIAYVEAHGTGTPLGDPIEIRALNNAFRAGKPGANSCAVGSVKSNVGHLDAAAGVAGLIKTVLALERRALPPSLHFARPNPQVEFGEGPFYVNAALAKWPGDRPRRAGVSSFGIGGTNAHVVLEEAPPPTPASESSRPCQVLVVSARSEAALDRAATNLQQYLLEHPALDLGDAAYTLAVGRRAFGHRRAIVGRGRLDGSVPGRVFSGFAEPPARHVAFVFSGQGSQYADMAMGLYQHEPVFRAELDRCAEILASQGDFDLRAVLGDDDRLSQTECAQPALFSVEYALSRLWMSFGVRPAAMIGHSIGEYTAACLAGVFTLEDVLRLVAARGRMMQQLPPGAMLAVPLPHTEAEALLGAGLSIGAVNGPSLFVISGERVAVDALSDRLLRQGVTCRRLRTSHAFHSEMMDPILDAYAERVREARPKAPEIPYLSNVTGTWITHEEAADPQYWARHLRSTVRFFEGVRELSSDPRRILVEVGPGRTAHSAVYSLRHVGEHESDVDHLLGSVAKLWVAGVDVDWAGFYASERRRRVPLPTYPFERQRYWIDAAPAAAKRANLAEWFYIPSWRRSVLGPPAPRASQPWLVFANSSELSEVLVKRLADERWPVIAVAAGHEFGRREDGGYVIDPGDSGHYRRLFGAIRDECGVPRDIVHLWNVGDSELGRPLAFDSLVCLAQALGELDTGDEDAGPIRIHVVSDNMQDVSGEPVLHPDKALLLGPVRVIAKEYPHVTCRSIDVAGRDRGLVDRLLMEFTSESPDAIVAYRDGHRWVETFERAALLEPAAGAGLRQGGTYLITGGFGGIGLVLAEHLGRAAKANLVLVSRSKNVPAERVTALEQLGAVVLAASADATDFEAMRGVVNQARARFGAIHGVIHAAGVAGGGAIQVKTPAAASAVLAPKVDGLKVLDRIFADTELDFLAVTSSLTAILGEFGQVDYCSANAFLDAYVHAARRSGQRAVSINWDTWQEVGMAVNAAVPEGLRALRSASLAHGIASREGVAAFERVLASGLPHVLVSPRDVHGRIRDGKRALSDVAPGAGAHERPALANAYAPPRSDSERTLAGVWSSLFGIEHIGVDDNFFELGGHSLLATQVISRVREACGVRLPMSAVFECPTVARLAERIEARQLEGILAEVSQLSEEEAQRELAAGESGT